MRIVVDFPAPFGPTKPVTPPSGRSRSISLTARRSPKSLVRPAVRIEAMAYRPIRSYGRCGAAGSGIDGEDVRGQVQAERRM
jgi:hypothetical protein